LFERLDHLDRRAGVHLQPVSKRGYQRMVVASGCVALAAAAVLLLVRQWAFGSILLAAGLLGVIERGRVFNFGGWPFMVPRRRGRSNVDGGS
jgi:hypothetical protein